MSDIRDSHGALSWGELLCNDPEKMASFYSAVFGYETTSDDMGNGVTYHGFKHGGKSMLGMMKKPAEIAQMPSMWGIYITVDDINDTVAKVQAQGGQVMRPVTDIPNVGRFAVLADPEGAVFQVMQYAMKFEDM